MKKTIQKEISETYCDITGKKLSNEYSAASLSLIGFCKNSFDEFVKDENAGRKNQGIPPMTKEEKAKNEVMFWDPVYLDLEFSNEIAVEIFKFLKKKYPKEIGKLVDLKYYSKFEGMPEQ